jgi:2,5-diketo-D-gluconate reductase B
MTLATASGKPLHPIGIGTWNMSSRIAEASSGGTYGDIEAVRGQEQPEIEAIRYSVSQGQNHIDCAELYGAFYTDEVVGQALAGVGVPRAELFIADKLWRHSCASGAVAGTVEQMLSKLGTDYLDLLYIHAPWPDVDWEAAIPQIDALVDSGVVRNFGVSNFSVDEMRRANELSTHGIAANQIHYNCLHKDEITDEFRAYCADMAIEPIAYQPVERGQVFNNEVIGEIAQSHSVSPAQIAIAWLLQMNVLTIPKAVGQGHIDENLAAMDIKLTDDEMRMIAAI